MILYYIILCYIILHTYIYIYVVYIDRCIHVSVNVTLMILWMFLAVTDGILPATRVVSSNWATPLAGWFISWKTLFISG